MNKYKHKTIPAALKASVYAEGQRAFKEGQQRGYNPYTASNVALAAIWWNGWDTDQEESQTVQTGKKKSARPVLMSD
jgi:hypothetical protein